MAVTMAEVKAVITADTTNFEAGVKRADKGVKDFSEQAKKRLASITEAFNKLGQAMSVGLTAPLIALGKASVDAAVRMDSLKRGLTAVAGSSEEAAKQLARLKEVAKLPGLSFEDAIQGSIRLQAAGFSAQQAEKSLRAFGNALATVGRGAAELNGVSLALSQIQSKGKVMAEEINQIAERVPQIRKIMLQAFGTADTEILQQAKITSAEFVSIITTELEKLPQVTGGLKNSFENAKDSINQSLARIGEAITPIISTILEKVVPAIEKWTKAFSELPKETQELIVKITALTITGGPLLLLTSQILELGKAIGLARIAALGPIAAVAALVGAGALAGLAAWNADSDAKNAAAGTTATQEFAAKLKEIDRKRKDLMDQINRDPRNPDGSVPLHTATLMQQLETLNKERVAAERRFIQAATDEQERGAKAQAKIRADLHKQQLAAEKAAAEARKRVEEAMSAKARAEAEKRAKAAAAEAERIRNLNASVLDDYHRLVDARYEYERFRAEQEYQDQVRDGAKKADAYRLYLAKIRFATIEMIAEVEARIKRSETPLPAFMTANRRGIDSLTRDINYAEPPSGLIDDVDPIRRDAKIRRAAESSLPRITDPEGNKREAQAEAFALDMVRSARRASRNFLQALFGNDRDRRGAIAGLIDDLKKSLIDSFFNLNLNLTPLFQNLGKTLQSGLISAVNAAIAVAQTGIGQMLGAVYQLLSALGRKGGFGITNLIGGALGFAFAGWQGAAYGANALPQLVSGDIGGFATSTIVAGATGTFGKVGPIGGSGGNGGFGPDYFSGSGGWGRSRSASVIYTGPVTVNERADLARLNQQTVRLLDLAVSAG